MRMRLLKTVPALALVLSGAAFGDETITPPVYPREAIAQCLSGEVKVELTFGDGGAVESAVVIDSTPKKIFDEAAVQAVRQWRLDPAAHPKGSKDTQLIRFEIPKNLCPDQNKT